MSNEVFNSKDRYDEIPMSLWRCGKCNLVWDKDTYEDECPRCDLQKHHAEFIFDMGVEEGRRRDNEKEFRMKVYEKIKWANHYTGRDQYQGKELMEEAIKWLETGVVS